MRPASTRVGGIRAKKSAYGSRQERLEVDDSPVAFLKICDGEHPIWTPCADPNCYRLKALTED